MIKILIDMNLSPQWEYIFKKEKFIAKHWSNIGNIGASDKIIIKIQMKILFSLISPLISFS